MEYGTKEGTAFIRRPASPGTVDPVIKIVDLVFVEGVFHLFGFTVNGSTPKRAPILVLLRLGKWILGPLTLWAPKKGDAW